MQKKSQLDALHGIRGIAAACVMIAHFKWLIGFQPLPQAHAAVDMFFVLSGFVLAHAYDPRFASGMTFRQFAVARVIRLYPLYFLALGIALIVVPLAVKFGISDGYSQVKTLAAAFFGLLFLPTPPMLSSDASLFPLNGPAWSLFWELAINAVFAVLALHLTKRRLQIVLLSGAVAICVAIYFYGSLGEGAYWRQWPVGMVRVWYSFFAGVYVQRHLFSRDAQPVSGSLGFAIIVILTLGVLMFPSTPGNQWAFDLVTTIVVWPALIYFATKVRLRGTMKRIGHWSGEASYGVYVLHIPLIALFAGAWSFTTRQPPAAMTPLVIGAIIICIFAIAFLANAGFDAPIRAWLTGKSRRSAKAEVVQF